MGIFEQSRDIVLSFLARGKPFVMADVEEKIKAQGLPMRVDANYTIRDYLSDLVEWDILRRKDSIYTVIAN